MDMKYHHMLTRCIQPKPIKQAHIQVITLCKLLPTAWPTELITVRIQTVLKSHCPKQRIWKVRYKQEGKTGCCKICVVHILQQPVSWNNDWTREITNFIIIKWHIVFIYISGLFYIVVIEFKLRLISRHGHLLWRWQQLNFCYEDYNYKYYY